MNRRKGDADTMMYPQMDLRLDYSEDVFKSTTVDTENNRWSNVENLRFDTNPISSIMYTVGNTDRVAVAPSNYTVFLLVRRCDVPFDERAS